jgi:hypothetical protein
VDVQVEDDREVRDPADDGTDERRLPDQTLLPVPEAVEQDGREERRGDGPHVEEPEADRERERRARERRRAPRRIVQLARVAREEVEAEREEGEAGDVGAPRLRVVEKAVGEDEGDGDEVNDPLARATRPQQRAERDDTEEPREPVEDEEGERDVEPQVFADEGARERHPQPREEPPGRTPEEVAELPEAVVDPVEA